MRTFAVALALVLALVATGVQAQMPRVVLTGSFDYTVAADRESVENLLVIHAPALAARYGENWQAHAAHSTRYAASP